MRQRLAEKYVNACIDDESVGEGFVGTIREIVWDTNKAAWIAQIHPDAGEPKSYPVASLPALSRSRNRRELMRAKTLLL